MNERSWKNNAVCLNKIKFQKSGWERIVSDNNNGWQSAQNTEGVGVVGQEGKNRLRDRGEHRQEKRRCQPKHSRGKEVKRTEIQRGEGYWQRSKGIDWKSRAPGLRRKTAGGLLAGSKEG